MSIKLIKIRNYKFNSKKNCYSKAKSEIIFCREDYSKYGYWGYNCDYLRERRFYRRQEMLMHNALEREFNKNTNLGIRAFVSEYRNNNRFNTRYRWCSDKMILSLIYNEKSK